MKTDDNLQKTNGEIEVKIKEISGKTTTGTITGKIEIVIEIIIKIETEMEIIEAITTEETLAKIT